MDKFFHTIKNQLPEPDKAWQDNTRNFVLSQFEAQFGQVNQTGKFNKTWKRISIFRQLALKPVAISAVLIILVLGGPLSVINAAQHSLLGDNLYNIKLSVNKAKKLVTLTKNKQVTLEIKFMGGSISDFENVVATKLVEQDSQETKVEKVKLAIDAVNKDIQSIDSKLNTTDVKKEKDAKKLAALVTQKKHNYQDSLNNTKKSLPLDVEKEVSQNLEDVENKLSQIHVKSLQILAQAHDEQGEEVIPPSELALLIEEEINTASNKANQLDQEESEENIQDIIEEQSLAVQDKLVNAQKMVNEGKLYMALVHVDEANQKMNIVEDIIEKVKQVKQEADSKIQDTINEEQEEAGKNTNTDAEEAIQDKDLKTEAQSTVVGEAQNNTSNKENGISQIQDTKEEPQEPQEFEIKIGD